MRIVAGTHRSRVLESPKGDAVRPTSDKVRGALFNMLQSRGAVEDAIVMDVFCGTGALGLEALSQGAQYCTFIDKAHPSIELTKRNIDTLKEKERTKVIVSDAATLPKNNQEAATLVFLDPPYGKDLIAPALQSLIDGNWLAPDCLCVIEESVVLTPPEAFEELTRKEYGDTHIALWRYIQPL